MCHNLLKLSDFVNLDLSKFLTVSVAGLETFAADLLEYNDLLGPAIVTNNSGLDHCTLYIRSADLYLTLIVNEEYLVELHSSTFGRSKARYKDLDTSLYFHLLACDVYDSVHLYKTF